MTDYSHELKFWGDCASTFAEEEKQYTYARLMGLRRLYWSFDCQGKSIIDIGGGPVSMLLKSYNFSRALVVDPLIYQYPGWIRDRYLSHTIGIVPYAGEEIIGDAALGLSDEAWIYNVLQHVIDPAKVVANALACASLLRIFEWINIPPHDGHPHMLTKEALDEWCGSPGQTTFIDMHGCFGECYFNVVPGRSK